MIMNMYTPERKLVKIDWLTVLSQGRNLPAAALLATPGG